MSTKITPFRSWKSWTIYFFLPLPYCKNTRLHWLATFAREGGIGHCARISHVYTLRETHTLLPQKKTEAKKKAAIAFSAFPWKKSKSLARVLLLFRSRKSMGRAGKVQTDVGGGGGDETQQEKLTKYLSPG